MSEVAIHFYRPKTLLDARGEDAFSFLQGQFTNQLQHPAGSSVYGLWLNQKGKVLADSVMLRIRENEFKIVSLHTGGAVIRERLEAYIIADDVILSEEGESAGLAVLGAESGRLVTDLLGALPAEEQFLQVNDLLVFAGKRTRQLNFEIIGPEASVNALKEKLRAHPVRELSLDEMEQLRIEAAIPRVPEDIGQSDLPNEAGLDEVAISYTKGCYLGQEVMARLKNLGQVRRRLLRVRGAGALPASLTALYQGSDRVGELRSTVATPEGFVGFAMCSLVKLKPELGLSLAPEQAPTVEIFSHG